MVALRGVLRTGCKCPIISGKNPSRPAAQMSRDEVKKAPLRAPKQETTTIHAKMIAPGGPNKARPKSSAIVLLRDTVSWSACQERL